MPESDSTALVVRTNPYDKVNDLVAYCESQAESTAIMIPGCDVRAGRALVVMLLRRNMDVMDFIQQYHLIQGRPVMRSDAMLANFASRGGKHVIIASTPDIAHLKLIDPDGNETEWKTTWADAQQESWPWTKGAGPGSEPVKKNLKDNWATPLGRENMLWWRTVSRGCHRVDPGLVAGLTPEDADFIDVIPSSVTSVDAAPRLTAAQMLAEKKAAEKAPPTSKEVDDDLIDAEFTVVDEPTPEPSTAADDDVQAGDGTITKGQREEIDALMSKLFSGDELQAVREATLKARAVNSFRSLSTEQAKDILSKLRAKVREVEAAQGN